jgi:hypothetical protein
VEMRGVITTVPASYSKGLGLRLFVDCLASGRSYSWGLSVLLYIRRWLFRIIGNKASLDGYFMRVIRRLAVQFRLVRRRGRRSRGKNFKFTYTLLLCNSLKFRIKRGLSFLIRGAQFFKKLHRCSFKKALVREFYCILFNLPCYSFFLRLSYMGRIMLHSNRGKKRGVRRRG